MKECQLRNFTHLTFFINWVQNFYRKYLPIFYKESAYEITKHGNQYEVYTSISDWKHLQKKIIVLSMTGNKRHRETDFTRLHYMACDSLADRYRRGNGSQLDNQHWCHKLLGTGCGICCLQKLYYVGSLCSKHTLADNLCMSPQNNLADKHRILPLTIAYRQH